MSDVTQSELKEALHYDPETGLFTWKLASNRKIKIGSVAGTPCNGYVRIWINSKPYLAHRLAWLYMTGEWPQEIDHINHIRDDNRWLNLRGETHHNNQKNLSMYKANKSGITGIIWKKPNKKWQVSIRAEGKQVYLGVFECKFEAVCVRKSAENKHGYHSNHGR